MDSTRRCLRLKFRVARVKICFTIEASPRVPFLSYNATEQKLKIIFGFLTCTKHDAESSWDQLEEIRQQGSPFFILLANYGIYHVAREHIGTRNHHCRLGYT
jgi:hypothetical protein